jgi:hypothetical protein
VRWKIVAVVTASTALVALAAGAAWRAVLTEREESRRGWAPDFPSTPRLGEVIDLSEVLDGDFARTSLVDFLDADTVVVAGEPDYTRRAETAETAETAQAARPSLTQLAALNVDTHQVEWSLDLGKEAGFPIARLGSAAPDETGGLVVDVSDEEGPDADAFTTLAVDAAGRVQGTRTSPRGVTAVAGGIAVFVEGDTVTAAATADLARPLWSASVGEVDQVWAPALRTADGVWVWTRDGYVDGATGEPVGFGADAEDPDIGYEVLGKDIVVRFTGRADPGGARSYTRIDPRDGSARWDSPADGASVCFGHADLVVCGEAGSSPRTVTAVEAASGAERWTSAVGRYDYLDTDHLAGGDIAVYTSGPEGAVSLLGARDGALKATIRDPGDQGFSRPILGKETLYFMAENTLHARSLRDGYPEAWTLVVGDGDGTLMVREGRLFVRTYEPDAEWGGGRYTLREVVAG